VASRALSGHESVAELTRERVRAAAQALGYRASVLARALSSGRNAPLRCAVVGLGLPLEVLGASFYGPVLAGLASAASGEAMDVHLVEIPGDEPDAPGREEAFRRLAAEDRADGFVILSFLSLTPRHLRPLDEAGVPYVLVNRHFEHLHGVLADGQGPTTAPPHRVNCVTLDWVAATEDAVRRLYGLGHRRMALLMPDSDRSTVWDHEQGWRRGRSACGLDEKAARMVRYPEDGLAVRIDALVGDVKRAGPTGPTAAVCFNDSTAFAVVRATLAAGVRVPEDLSVIGFDNRIGEYTTPALCSYDPHLLEVGKAAAQLMADVLRGESEEPQRITVPSEFVCRGTCGPAPS
jgi:LacI family transcriptional regulator